MLAFAVAACGHHGAPQPSGPSRALLGEAAHIGRISYEDDFQEARLVLQALPPGAKERLALRENLLHYLLDPLVALQPEAIKRELRELENDDTGDRVLDSFRDALSLFEPAELWSVPPRVSPTEKALLDPAARRLFGPGWADRARHTVGQFRAAHDVWAGDPAFTGLAARLAAGCREFATWWDDHSIAVGSGSGRKVLHHPVRGVLTYDYATFQSNDDAAVRLAVYTPAQ